MKTYLVQMCKEDGTTPLGQCLEYQIDVEDHQNRDDAAFKAYSEHPGEEIVSIGLKTEIEAFEKEWGIAR